MLNERRINSNINKYKYYMYNIYNISKGKINYNKVENIIKYKNNVKLIIKDFNKEKLNESDKYQRKSIISL